MASLHSTGSPPSRGRPSAHFVIHDEFDDRRRTSLGVKHGKDSSDGTAPLSTSKFGNLQAKVATKAKLKPILPASKHNPWAGEVNFRKEETSALSMDKLIAKLTDHQVTVSQQRSTDSHNSDEENVQPKDSLSGDSNPPTPNNGPTSESRPSLPPGLTNQTPSEIARLQQELNDAKNCIARQAQELDQTRLMKHSIEQHTAPGSSETFGSTADIGTGYPPVNNHPWTLNDDGNLELSHVNNGFTAWNGASVPGLNYATRPELPWSLRARPAVQPNNAKSMASLSQRGGAQRFYSSPVSPKGKFRGRGAHEFSPGKSHHGGGEFTAESEVIDANFAPRSMGFELFPGAAEPVNNNFGMGGMSSGPSFPNMGMFTGHHPQPIGPPLNPQNIHGAQTPVNPWNSAGPSSPGQTYVSPMEPLNYRRLLDRTVSCNWKYIVDKIVCNKDQQASIFLQQKLKVGTAEQKYDIVEAIVAQAYPLMINRFGNFLVQRCFEHGTPEQVVAIANAIRGNTLSLSMDAFGCHVVQKAFDAVPEEHKAIMVHELLRRIPETVIHKYACHVWQKLFELRWSDSPPQIMRFVNEALKGMWHEVALGETGSLVVQNIFENCLEEDKRPCINEVLDNIDLVAHGQFGNWCIQHVCEHGAPADRSHAIDHVLRYATEYSMDQFASKVVEKCLKIGGADFLERYLDRVCKGRPDRPRIPLIDIASDQYGNYLIQYILTHANSTHREIVASHIRKHMVSLRGSKFGSRVGMLCGNSAYNINSGPGTVMVSNNRFSSAPANFPRFGGAYR